LIKKIAYLFFFFSLLAINACKSKKQLLHTNLPSVGIDSIYQNIFNPEHINWFSGRAKVKVTSPQGTDRFVMFIRMKHDSIIWTVIKKLGIEGGRALIDKDSVSIIYRMPEKAYQIISLDELSKSFGMTPHLEDIQSLIKGRVPNLDTTLLWNIKEDNQFYNFRSIKDDIIFDFNFDKSTAMLKNGHFIDRFNLNGHWDYDDYRIVNNIAVPFFRKYTAEFGPDNYLNVTLDFTDIELNIPNSTRFEIPPHYKKVD